MSPLRVLSCASEMAPYAKTGGLADVAGALPPALARAGARVTCMTPLYDEIERDAHGIRPTGETFQVRSDAHGEPFRVHRARRDDVTVYFLESKRLFARRGLYGEGGRDFADNCRRFALFSTACLELSDRIELHPDVVHAHDWQTALAPVYIQERSGPRARTLLTIHNLAYQGLFPAEDLQWTGLDASYFHWQRMEFHGKVNLLKGGIVYADAVSTVSPTYAQEIQHSELGCGLDGVLTSRHAHLHGILNGIDTRVWDPATDPLLPARYGPQDLAGKARCRDALIAEAQIAPTDRPLMGMVTRLAEQKGLDILIPALRALLGRGESFVILGTGDPSYEVQMQELKEAFPGQLGLFLAFDNRRAHLIEAGSDMFLMPSRFEPCGLNQFYSMRYGTVPVVRATGGLADSVTPFSPEGVHAGLSTGFTFHEYSPEALISAIEAAAAVFADPPMWRRVMRNGMSRDFGWDASAARYMDLYRKLTA